jgi:hypothetical protein
MGREVGTMPVLKPTSHIPEPAQTSHLKARDQAKTLGASLQTHGESHPIHGAATTIRALLLLLAPREVMAKAAVDCSTCLATSSETTELA